MSTRWLIRLVVLVSVLLLGAMADAQQPSGGASPAPAPAPSGGARAAAPAPKAAPAPSKPAPAPAPAPVRSSGNTGAPNGGGNTPSPTNNGSAGSVNTGTGSAISGTGAPITQTPAPSMGNRQNPPPDATRTQRDQQLRGRPRPRKPNDPNNPNVPTFILPQQYGWAPYTWWYNGNNYWMPPVWSNDYYDDNGYYGDGYRAADDSDRYDRVAPPPTPATPSPTQEQARAANALQGMPAYNQAMVEFKSAQAAYDDAVARVMDRLRQDPEYKRLVAQRDRADDRVEAVQAGARIAPNPDRVLPAAQQKLQVSSKITRMEQDAIAADPQASAAKAKLVAANEKLAALRKQAGAGGGGGQGQ
jgi:hypothetical protein